MSNLTQPLSPELARYRFAALVCFYCLLLYFAYSSYQALPSPNFSSLIIWLIQIAPLLLFAPGLHLNILRSNIWMSFIVLVYFIHGVLIAFDSERTAMGIIEIVLCVGLFSSLVLMIRKQQAKLKSELKSETA